MFYNDAKTITCSLYIKSDYRDICILKSKISLSNSPWIHVWLFVLWVICMKFTCLNLPRLLNMKSRHCSVHTTFDLYLPCYIPRVKWMKLLCWNQPWLFNIGSQIWSVQIALIHFTLGFKLFYRLAWIFSFSKETHMYFLISISLWRCQQTMLECIIPLLL